MTWERRSAMEIVDNTGADLVARSACLVALARAGWAEKLECELKTSEHRWVRGFVQGYLAGRGEWSSS